MHSFLIALRNARLGLLVAAFLSAVLLKLTGYLPALSWWLVTSPATVGIVTATVVQAVRLVQQEIRNA